MRKLISWFLTLVLVLSLLLSLVPSALADDVYTLDIYWVGNGDNTPVREGVEKAINEYIEPIIGANVVFHIIGWGDWDDKAINALQSGEKMDLIFTAEWQDYMTLVSSGLLTALDDPAHNLIEMYGQGIEELMPDGLLDAAKVNGTLYAVPANKESCIVKGVVVNKTAANAIGWDVQLDDPSITCEADLEPWLQKYKEMFPDKYPYLTEGVNGLRWADTIFAPINATEGFASVKYFKQENGEFDTTVYNLLDQPEFEENIRLKYRWAQAGYIDPEATLLTYDHNSIFGRGDFLVFTQNLKGNEIKAHELYSSLHTAEFEVTEIALQPKYLNTVDICGSMFAIPITSQNPDKAMQLLNMMHSDVTLCNLVTYGVEGENYIKLDDTFIENIPSANWSGIHAGPWSVGNMGLQYVTKGEDPNKYQILLDYGKDAIPTFILGFRTNTDNIVAEVAACTNVVDEYLAPMQVGAVDPDDPTLGLDAARQAMKDAGIDAVVAEMQKQLDAWLAQ